MLHIRTIRWVPQSNEGLIPGQIEFIDQTRLPLALRKVRTADPDVIFRAIRALQVRGAPAIGVAAAMGVAAAAQRVRSKSGNAVAEAACQAARRLATARPTAVNLFQALDRMRRTARRYRRLPPDQLKELLASEAVAIWQEDRDMCRRIGESGFPLIRNARRVLTHCNAGALATAGLGTALSPLYVAREQGCRIHVYVDETRPLLQGARLTAWELTRADIEVTVICDNMAAWLMQRGQIDAVLVGADRIARNGDTANKIGTYGLAVLAHFHGIPFYVLAPSTTVDFSARAGRDIPIEERGSEEVSMMAGRRLIPRAATAISPAFDVTPARLITAVVCERGVLKPPYTRSLSRALEKRERQQKNCSPSLAGGPLPRDRPKAPDQRPGHQVMPLQD